MQSEAMIMYQHLFHEFLTFLEQKRKKEAKDKRKDHGTVDESLE